MTDAPLPFGLPGPTALYVTLYAATLVAHVVLIGYVLAGAGYVAVDAVFGRRGGDDDDDNSSSRPAVAPLVRDWLPFALGAAITAGVAPLLFVQILYKRGFYTANLLLFHRWMALVPVLIAGFYLLYLLKSSFVARRGPRARAIVAALAFGCFAFTAWAWTENHLLSRAEHAWVDLYASGAMTYREPAVLMRLAIWIGGAFPILAALAGLQLAGAERRAAAHASPGQWRALAATALVGFAIAGVAALAYARELAPAARDALWSPATRPYVIAGAIAIAAQVAVWIAQLRPAASRAALARIAVVATPVAILGVVAVREAVRLATVDLGALVDQHARIARAPGLWLFLALFAVNAAVIAWLVSRVRRQVAASR